jgi:hypothetical protein
MKRLVFKIIRLPLPWFVRRNLSKFISLFLPSRIVIPGESSFNQGKMERLLKDGYIVIDNFLSDIEIDTIYEQIRDFQVFDPWDSSVISFDPSNPPPHTHVGYYREEDLLKIAIIDEIAKSKTLEGYLSRYLGNNYKCVNHSLWWTFGGKNNPQEAENFHRDIDNLSWLKVFIYLTDVDENTGPHAFIPKSHRSTKKLTFQRFSDDEAESIFGRPVYHTGRRGTMIIEDTFGLHKGQFIKNEGKRLLLQLQFAIFNNPY